MAEYWKYIGTCTLPSDIPPEILNEWKETLKAEQARIYANLQAKVPDEVAFLDRIADASSDEYENFLQATGGRWVRVPYYMEVYASYVGLMEGEGAELLRFRRYIDATDVKIFADIHIKHAYPLLQRRIEDAACDAIEMGLADAIIVTGKATGRPTNLEDIKAVKESIAETGVPLLVGSGVNVDNVERYWPYIDGIIVGTSLKVDGVTTNPVDVEKVKRFMSKIRELRRK